MTTASIAWQWGDVDASAYGERTCLSHRHADAQLWVADGRLTRGAGYRDASFPVRRELARVGAIVRLRQRGRYLVHAAGVVDPAGRAWLLSGDSGSGKSTLAYALARVGWSVLGDDGVLIEPRGAGLVAHPWRDALRVSAQLAASFPEVRSDSLRPAPGDPRSRVSIEMRAARSTPVAALVLIERGTTFEMTTARPARALAALVRQSPWVILGDQYSRPHLDVLRHAAAQRVFHLRHTPAELHSLADILLGAIA